MTAYLPLWLCLLILAAAALTAVALVVTDPYWRRRRGRS